VANLGIIAYRLFIAPTLCIMMLAGVHVLWPGLEVQPLLVLAIILLMPVSVTSTVLTEKMNQDTALAAQAVLYTTLASMVTVPPMYLLARTVLTKGLG
jgi:predicted permease